jgi:cell division protein FtsQ
LRGDERGRSRTPNIFERIERRLPRGVEVALLAALFGATGLYGATLAGSVDSVTGALRDVGDAIANTAGFPIEEVAIAGTRQITRVDVLATADITPTTSLLLLDPEATRVRLKQNPWIREATVRKLYPGRLEISVEERTGFALWQHNGRLSVIARDGTVIGADARRHLHHFPLVVGKGAEQRAADLVALVERFPEIHVEFAAGVLVAERRWNIRLKNGIDIRLPEQKPEAALARLVALDKQSKILTRDVTVIDLRHPEQVAVTPSEDAAAARAAALKARTLKKKGADT